MIWIQEFINDFWWNFSGSRDRKNSLLDFGGAPDHDLVPWIFKWFFIYYCDSCRQPRIKCENPPRRFELAECFSFCFWCFLFVIWQVVNFQPLAVLKFSILLPTRWKPLMCDTIRYRDCTRILTGPASLVSHIKTKSLWKWKTEKKMIMRLIHQETNQHNITAHLSQCSCDVITMWQVCTGMCQLWSDLPQSEALVRQCWAGENWAGTDQS